MKKKRLLLRYEGSKTKKEWVIPLHTKLVSALQKYLTFYEQKIHRKLNHDDFLFSSFLLSGTRKHHKHGELRPQQITAFFGRLSCAAKIKAGAHRFRHTLATELCNPQDGSPPDVFSVQEILGHSSLAVTKGYVAPNINRLAAVLEKYT